MVVGEGGGRKGLRPRADWQEGGTDSSTGAPKGIGGGGRALEPSFGTRDFRVRF